MIIFKINLWITILGGAIWLSGQVANVPAVTGNNEIKFKKVRGADADGAVLGFGEQGKFDANWVTCPPVVWDGNEYKMWYSPFYDSKMGKGGIGQPTSKDGIKWNRQNNGEPVFKVSAGNEFDGGQVMGPEVMRMGKTYNMWYTGMAKEWHESGFGFYRIGLATSSNGFVWRRANSGYPVVDTGTGTSFDNVQVATPSIIKENILYKMWYAAWSSDPNNSHHICLAYSSDGINWEKQNDGKPIAGLNPEFAYGPAVVKSGGDYILFYMAIKATPGLFAAKSKDGIHWEMLKGGNPVLLSGTGDDFDSFLVGHPFALIRDGKIMLWYTGYKRINGGMKLSIGLAVQKL